MVGHAGARGENGQGRKAAVGGLAPLPAIQRSPFRPESRPPLSWAAALRNRSVSSAAGFLSAPAGRWI